MTETTLTLYDNTLLVELKSYECCDGVTVTASDYGYFTLDIQGLSEGEVKNIVKLTFITSENAMFGSSDFVDVSSEDHIISQFGKLTIYQMGDVNMDGRVNTVDAAMI